MFLKERINPFIVITITIFSLIMTGCDKEDDNVLPSCDIISPEQGDSVKQGRNVTIVAEASDEDGTITSVRFLIDGYLASADYEAPYRYVWTTENVDQGTYQIQAEARDNEQAKSIDKVDISIYNETEITEIEMINIEGGIYIMGCTSEQEDCFENEYPIHKVRVDTFEISKYEITNHQYAAFMNQTNVNSDGIYDGVRYLDLNTDACQINYENGEFVVAEGQENYPVVNVSWFGAQAFCEYHNGRLPTEAEWEYAARGGSEATQTIYSGSNDIELVAWYANNSDNRIKEVGTRAPNELDISDMSGNVWEWCSDWYSVSYYSISPFYNPQGPSSGTYRVKRGGIFNGTPRFCRVTYRDNSYPENTSSGTGFRMAKDVR